MGKMHTFGGATTNIPGVYIKRQFPPSLDGEGAATGVTVILGECAGGVPYTAPGTVTERINYSESAADALELLEAGPAYYATEFFLTPHKDERFAKPGYALTCRVNKATQAGSTITSGATDCIRITAARYGASGNHLARKIQAGSVSGKHVQVVFKGKTILDEDNVGAEHLELQYTGTGTAATVSITSTGLSTTVTAGNTGDNLSLTFAEYPTIQHLVNYLAEHPNYICTLKGSSDTRSETCDIVTDEDILTQALVVRGDVEALIQKLNSCEELSAELLSTASRTSIDNDANFVFCTGGTSSIATVTDWRDALKLLEDVELNHIVVASGDPVVHAMVDQHCQAMSSIEEKKYRRAGAGASSIVTGKQARIDEMKALNSSRFDYCITPFDRIDALTNTRKTFSPFYLHALIAGYRSANHVTMDTVFKTINVLGVGETYTRGDMKAYIDAGATLIAEKAGVFEVVSENTTYQGSNLILCTPSLINTVDYISKDIIVKVRAQIASLDRAPDSIVITKIENWLFTELFPYYRDTQKVITNDPTTGVNAFSNVSFIYSGNTFEVNARLVVVTSPRFGFFTLDFVVPGQK